MLFSLALKNRSAVLLTEHIIRHGAMVNAYDEVFYLLAITLILLSVFFLCVCLKTVSISQNGNTPLHISVEVDCPDNISVLIKHGANIEYNNEVLAVFIFLSLKSFF